MPHRVGGGGVKQSDLLVEYSYYGPATERWDPRSARDDEVQHSEWGSGTGDLYLNPDVFLGHVPEEIWRYELGGYPVLKKWLGYRQAARNEGRALTLQELDTLRGIIHRIAAVLVLRPQLNAAYEKAAAHAWLIDDFRNSSPDHEYPDSACVGR